MEPAETRSPADDFQDQARARVFDRLGDLAAVFPQLETAPDPHWDEGLNEQDAAFAHAILNAAVRHWRCLSFLLNLRLKTPLEQTDPSIAGVLLGAGAQILFLDRVPPHAAVDSAVDFARFIGAKPGVCGMINAVLRRLTELPQRDREGKLLRVPWKFTQDHIPLGGGEALALKFAVFPPEKGPRLATVTSHPPGLIARWLEQFGPEQTVKLAEHTLGTPPTVLNVEHARSPLPDGWLGPHTDPNARVWIGPPGNLRAFLASRPDVWVQDATSAEACRILGPLGLNPRVIVDLCAGRGTKTRQLASMFPEATVLASDTDESRLEDLRRSVCPHHPKVRPVVADMVSDSAYRAGRADLVLLDVPCSNTGVLARRAEAKHRASSLQLERLTALQRELIQKARNMLAPGGVILYSTCSIDPEENQAQAEFIRSLGFELRASKATMPHSGWAPGEGGGKVSTYRDGGFAAALRMFG